MCVEGESELFEKLHEKVEFIIIMKSILIIMKSIIIIMKSIIIIMQYLSVFNIVCFLQFLQSSP